MEYNASDNLVLQIVEHDVDSKNTVKTLYILYDTKLKTYVLRGKRYGGNVKSCTYSFECRFADDLVEFLEFVLDKHNNYSYILYNYDNLPDTSNQITFEFLKRYDSIVYEISGYDNKPLKRSHLMKYLKMLRNITNNY